MSKLFLLTSNKCLSNSLHTERYHLNANGENYFPFNILGAEERIFEVYLNLGNIDCIGLLRSWYDCFRLALRLFHHTKLCAFVGQKFQENCLTTAYKSHYSELLHTINIS